ncbi:3-oxoacyl-ACP synthase III family protein [Mesoterricola sediminis]|uniref:3-oxoacyl-ACP synthase n=1 Tax=Mesoterricola sediminis TaxID=2927980 RepID=A0AA48KHT3_9BACT|nr:ketoacyl-ACP synthase III [Mesoterricola sediminis]BDU78683.1 3-oxoacyl-ACP synthase [Mesoterricola sediminis]
MMLAFEDCAITGLLTVLPEHERTFLEEMEAYKAPLKRSLKLKEVMGYDRHRIVDGPVCASDLVCRGLEHLFERGLLERDGFDALILVTQSPDHFIPPTSNVVQGRLGLGHDVLCLDINQGCAGFLIGLMQGFLLLAQPSIRKVVVANADLLSRKVSKQDRNSWPLIGDAASITVLERRPGAPRIHLSLKMDGTRREALMIPAGGFRQPSSPGTAVMAEDPEGNLRAPDNLVMDGSAVFNFVQVEVPPLVEDLLARAGRGLDTIDTFLFHQPNRFMLEKLADRMGVPRERMPNNIVEHYGNSSGVTIPLALAHNHRAEVLSGTLRTCFAGFGVGLTWGAMLADVGPLRFCEMIDFK